MLANCRAKVALQKLNTDVVHGVSSGNLDVDAIALDNRDVQSALGGAVAAGKILAPFRQDCAVPQMRRHCLCMQ